ncbi:MAG: hypothetical protein IPL07_12670 [Acidimicrobiaceae bacterium]|nr:hypothetical protein [Acidimicrobiaceae bacterium]
MAWKSANPVAWKRLCIEWAVIGTVVAVVSLVATDNRNAGSYLTILLGGFVYVAFGAVLAKFGYQRKTLKQIRAEAAAAQGRQGRSAPGPARPGRRPPAAPPAGPQHPPTER